MEFKKFLILDSCMNYKYFILIQLINLILKKTCKKGTIKNISKRMVKIFFIFFEEEPSRFKRYYKKA